MYRSYEEALGHGCDFRVKYRLYSVEEGGRDKTPCQGIRWDFWYESDNHTMKGIFIIWPEFEDKNGTTLFESSKNVPSTGTARMWIISKPLRKYHQEKIKVGAKGYFYEGKKIGECEIIEINNLMTNPVI
ncbi:MAG: hypothetical protein V4685_01385 [Bacteroidota bacterium]